MTAASVLVFAGCTTSEVQDVAPEEGLVTMQPSLQDWVSAAESMVGNLLVSGALDNAPRQPARVALSDIRNKTSIAELKTNVLAQRIFTLLQNSGKVAVSIDKLAEQKRQKKQAAEDLMAEYEGTYDVEDSIASEMGQMPDYTLSGTVTDEFVVQGKTRQRAYTVHIVLTDVETNQSVWQDFHQITRHVKKASVSPW